MKFSCFAPMSLYRLRRGAPDAKAIYQSLLASFGDQYSTELGTRIEAMCFARALGIARADRRQRQAVNQRLPWRTCEGLPKLERELGIIPGAQDTIQERRAVVAVRSRLPAGGTRQEIETSLQDILGADFIAYHTNDAASATLTPAAIGDWPMNLQLPNVARKVVRLTAPVVFIGVPFVASVVHTARSPNVEVGDVLVFDVGRWGQMDRVTVAAPVTIGTDGAATFTATFTRPHEAGVFGFTHPLPAWSSTKRHATIVVTTAVVADAEKRRKVNEQMARIARSVSTWDIVEGNSTQTTRFQLDEPSLSRRTLATITL